MTLREVKQGIRTIIKDATNGELCELLIAARNNEMPFSNPTTCLAGRLGLGTAWTITAWFYRELGQESPWTLTNDDKENLRQARIIPIIKAEIKRRLNEKNNSNSSLYNDSPSNREYGIEMAIKER